MSRPFVIGLTGSIGMGKTTTAAMFAAAGVPVWDADAAVHRLYGAGGAAVPAIAALCPDAIVDGAVSRAALRAWIARDDGALGRIEAAVHPLVATDRADFIANCRDPIALVDVPLLFETEAAAAVDLVVVASAPHDIQRQRVLSRPGMTPDLFARISTSQMPDAEKRTRADAIIDTSGLEPARAQVQTLLDDIRKRLADA